MRARLIYRCKTKRGLEVIYRSLGMLAESCDRCGSRVPLTLEAGRTLQGGVFTKLCNPCMTVWDEIVRHTPVWQRWIDLKALERHYNSLAQAGRPVEEAEWIRHGRDMEQAHKELHAVGLEFLRERQIRGDTERYKELPPLRL